MGAHFAAVRGRGPGTGLGVLFAALAVLALAPPALAQVSFSGPTNFPADQRPRSVAVGDFNADSDPDLAVANAFSNDVSVLLGGAGGGFSGPTNFPAGDTPHLGRGRRLQRRLRPRPGGRQRRLRQRLGAARRRGGSFGAPTNFPAGQRPISVAVGDFNADSDPDLAVANNGSGDVSVLLGGARRRASAARPTSPPAAPPARSRSATSTPTPTPTWR